MNRFCFLLIIILLPGLLSADQKIYLDNEEIQEYKGKLGKWCLIDNRKTMISLSQNFYVDIKEIYKINNIDEKHPLQRYYFISYSNEYLKELEEKNIKRKIIISKENEFIWPIFEPIRISSVLGFRNGKFHPGLDVPAVMGKPILAAMEGLILFSNYAEGYGRIIIIEHRNNYITKYAHNSVNFAKQGDFVKKGQIIGLTGSTGICTGNHLHFELRCSNIPLDPLDFLPKIEDLNIVHTLKNWK